MYFLDPDYQATLRATRYVSDGVPSDPNDVQVFQQIHTALTQEANNAYISSFLTVVEWICQSGHNPEEIHMELHETERPLGGDSIQVVIICRLPQKFPSYHPLGNKWPPPNQPLFVLCGHN